MAHIVGSLTANVAPAKYDLEGIDRHAQNIQTNAWDINSGLRHILATLRGEESLCGGVSGETPVPSGKLREISLTQQGTRGAQEETFQLIAELKDLLSVNA